MKRFLGLILATGLALPAQADDGAVAAGIAGGLLGGLVLGSALTPRPVYEGRSGLCNSASPTVLLDARPGLLR
jgi:hypothetical protein